MKTGLVIISVFLLVMFHFTPKNIDYWGNVGTQWNNMFKNK